MPIKTSSAIAKGRKFQQLVRDKLTELIKPYGAKAEDVKSTSMGAGGEDVQLSPFARTLLPISVECKAKKGIAVYAFYEQAKENSNGYHPVVFIKADRKNPLVLLDLDYYLELERNRIEKEKEG